MSTPRCLLGGHVVGSTNAAPGFPDTPSSCMRSSQGDVEVCDGRLIPLTQEVIYTDFTELIYAGGRAKAYLVPFLDHGSRVVLGWAVGVAAVTELALGGWEDAKRGLESFDGELRDVIVRHDRDSVFTSYAWTAKLLIDDGVRPSYALGGASDNTKMESFFGRFKVENRSLLTDVATLAELEAVVQGRIAHYNNVRLHPSLGNSAPAAFLSRWIGEGKSQT